MANISCTSCEDLRQRAPSLIVNGLDDTMVTNLKNDLGLVASDSVNDCTALNDMNDCLVGNEAEEVELYEVCDWKKFMKQFIPNLWTTLKAMIAAICGLWTNIHELWEQIMLVSYVGILTLYVDNMKTNASGTEDNQVLAFDRAVRQGNMPNTVLNATSNKEGVTIKNTTTVPLLIEATVNVSVRTTQHMVSCYLSIARDGTTIGQTPFITPTSYDQQCEAEAFILEAGEEATLTYYFGVGDANGTSWFKSLFYPDGTEDAHLCLEPNIDSNPKNQRSYFTVRATSIVSTSSN